MAENTSTKPSVKEQIKEITERMESGIQDLFTSEKYTDYLKTMSKFYNYSTRNTLLIHMQMPGASKVAGFNAWRDKFERHVKKGEKGIKILAPAPFKTKQEMEKLDPDTQAPMLDETGKPVVEEVEITIPQYKIVPVFDVSQTDGKPLPQLAEDLTGDVRQYEAFMDALKQVSPLPVVFEPLSPDMDGFCRYGEKIVIREGMSEVQTVSAAIHEIAHGTLHGLEQAREAATQEGAEPPKPKDRRTKEVEAESVSYAVCQYYGIETAANSFGYLATWSKDRELSELKASLDTIRKTAATLIASIDERFPDPDIGPSERDLYGYSYEKMMPLTQDRALELFDQDHTVYLLYPDNTEGMAFDREDIQNHDGIFGIEREEWEATQEFQAMTQTADNSEASKESMLVYGKDNTFGIYQLKCGDDLHYHRFASLDQLDNDQFYYGKRVAYEGFSFVGSSGAPIYSKITDSEIMCIGINCGHYEMLPQKIVYGDEIAITLNHHSGISYFYKSTDILNIINAQIKNSDI